MTAVDDLIAGMIREEGGFQKALKRVMENDLHMTVNEFSRATGIPQSTMYKILEDQREPNLRTARAIIRAVKIMSAESGQNFIAVIASHHVLQVLEKETIVDGRPVKLSFPGAKRIRLYLLDDVHALSLIAEAPCDTLTTVAERNSVLLAEADGFASVS